METIEIWICDECAVDDGYPCEVRVAHNREPIPNTPVKCPWSPECDHKVKFIKKG